MKKLSTFLCLILSLSLILSGCNQSKENTKKEIDFSNWDSVLENAHNTTVNFYGWGGSQEINSWLDTVVKTELKSKYNIDFKRVPMDASDFLTKLLSEKQLNSNGTMDIIWINGENFFTAKENELLHGPFTDSLPNFNKYVDSKSPDVEFDFGYPTEGFEAPYGKAQLVFIYDKNKWDSYPKNHKELLEFAKKHPGKITYPAAPDFTGSAFIRNIIYDIVGYKEFMNPELTKEELREITKPAMAYLKELAPYLWREGKTYPANNAQLDNLYADGEIEMTITYNPNTVSSRIKNGEFANTSQNFLFDNGTIGNTHFLAIPYNAPNKVGAYAVINEILSPKIQTSKFDPINWGDLPVLSPDKLSDEERTALNSVKGGLGTLPAVELLSHRVPEMPANLVPIIEEIWTEDVLEAIN